MASKVIGNDINKLEGGHIQGFVVIDVESADGKIKRHIQPNTVTDVGKMAMLSRSANEMLMGFSGTPYGRMSSTDLLGCYAVDNSNSNGNYNTGQKRYTKQDNGLNNYLLNLGSGVTLSASSKFVPLFDANFNIDDTKMIGFANSRTVTANTKEGIQDFTKPAYMIDDICVANRWKYAEGYATGTFDHIVMAPGLHGDFKCNGMYVKKCITKINQFENIAEFGNKFIIPGAGAITSSTKILLDFNRNSVSRWYYDLSTGETTAVPNTDVAYSMTMYESLDQLIDGGYLYILDKSGTVRKINTTTGATDASLDLVEYYNQNFTYGSSMYKDGTNLIVLGSYNSADGQNDSYAKAYTIAISTFTKTSVNKTAFTGYGGLPTGWDKNRMIVKKCGSYYYANHGYEVIKCTDITNIKGTVVASYLAHPLVHYASDGANTWMIEMGANEIDYKAIESNKASISQNNFQYRVMDNGTERKYQYYNQGIWISKEMAGNLLSFVKLASPITKAATDIMYVSYGYKFV